MKAELCETGGRLSPPRKYNKVRKHKTVNVVGALKNKTKQNTEEVSLNHRQTDRAEGKKASWPL